MPNRSDSIGRDLRLARKKRFPNDNLSNFATRIGVARATLQKMEKGDLSVSMDKYVKAAEVLGLQHAFDALFRQEPSLFDDASITTH